MKSKILLQLCIVACLSMLLSSCSNSRYAQYEKRSPGYSLNKKLNDKNAPRNIFNGAGKIEEVSVIAPTVEAQMPVVAAPAELVSASVNTVSSEATAVNTVSAIAPVIKNNPIVFNADQKQVSKNSWLMKKVAKSIYKSAAKKEGSDLKSGAEASIVEVILAIFLPPLAVFLHDDGITTNFWIDLILTILFWIPGVIFAFLAIFDIV